MKQDCEFKTERLIVEDWLHQNEDVAAKLKFAKKINRILTPEVTKSLPKGWQHINTLDQANKWIFDRVNESIFLTVNMRSNNELIGFIFLYESENDDLITDLRFGYLIGQSFWGKGLGSELINGLVEWCKKSNIHSLSGGVEHDNIGSIKIMEKTGFSISKENKTTNKVLFYERLFK
ncbi:GNAT family N-acetyltransferase [Marinifilum sp. N1E240]|uniref:GNAT family N-acetyltransferase n=1 Tax=Marinifilum sp. N1E240 TaxID=2608082 RepID=UPI00128E4B64|nr:GNAT family N-acetyltransferase [Marinifilum sp. N1E240]MPQ49238.1 GNAT family N-acetyltransferase [Marinifilum sp. N1E240]